MNFSVKLISDISNLKRPIRKFILIFFDANLIFFSFLLSFWIEKNLEISYLQKIGFSAFFYLVIVGLSIYFFTGQYKGINRFNGSKSIYEIAGRNFLFIIVLLFLSNIIPNLDFIDFRVLFLIWFLTTGLIGAFHFSIRDLQLNINPENKIKKKRIAIYGAGSTGAQLAKSILLNGKYQIQRIFDDDNTLWGRTLNGIKIENPKLINNFKYDIDQVFLAIPTLNQKRIQEITKLIKLENIEVLLIPSIDDLTSGKVNFNKIRPVSIDDLLGRDPVISMQSHIKPYINNSNICVTGGAGSIGSEICRQIINLGANSLIVIDNNEYNLFQIEKELEIKFADKTIIYILEDVSNQSSLEKIFKKYDINIVYHAAAYKHVPILEKNPLIGIKNNVFATLSVCNAGKSSNLRNVILISSDKAVRPTNLMGATKRLSEIIVLYFHQMSEEKVNDPKNKTFFSMVRFGNVLGSSGSVIPIFKKQIEMGGPITVTHPEINRYFMTIKEASELVIQSTAISKGGETFLLDMGKPIMIKNLAREMIRLSNLKVKDKKNTDGDIEILYTGLRSGEKLYEELLVDGKSVRTIHPLIFKAKENKVNTKNLLKKLLELKSLVNQGNKYKSLELLQSLIPEWKRGNI